MAVSLPAHSMGYHRRESLLLVSAAPRRAAPRRRLQICRYVCVRVCVCHVIVVTSEIEPSSERSTDGRKSLVFPMKQFPEHVRRRFDGVDQADHCELYLCRTRRMDTDPDDALHCVHRTAPRFRSVRVDVVRIAFGEWRDELR